jgi:hypothetical protein
VRETLTNLEIEMERILSQVRNGIRALQHLNPSVQAHTSPPPEENPE